MKKFLILIASIFLLVSCEVAQEETYCIIVDKMYQKSYSHYTQVGGIRRRHHHPERYILVTYCPLLKEEIYKDVSHDQYESLNVGDSVIHSYYYCGIKKK